MRMQRVRNLSCVSASNFTALLKYFHLQFLASSEHHQQLNTPNKCSNLNFHFSKDPRKLQCRRHHAVGLLSLGLAIITWPEQENRAQGGGFSPSCSPRRQLGAGVIEETPPPTDWDRGAKQLLHLTLTLPLPSTAASDQIPF